MPSGEQKAFEYPRLPPQQLSLRWRDTASVLVPPGPIDTRSYEICAIPDDTTARQFIEQHHYSGEYVPARFRFGLHHRSGELNSVAVFSVPVNYHSFDRFQLRDPWPHDPCASTITLQLLRPSGKPRSTVEFSNNTGFSKRRDGHSSADRVFADYGVCELRGPRLTNC